MGMFDLLLDNSRQDGDRKMNSITVGVVKENWDEKHPGMVKVEIIMGEEGKNLTDWIRVARPYAGPEYGFYMLPEVGDEVLVAFNMGDINKPYVIGSLWNQEDKIPPGTAVEKNTIKRMKTKGGHELIFNDDKEKGSIEIHTAKKLTISLADEKKVITIKDEKGKNLLAFDCEKGSITIKSENSIELNSGGSASLKLDGKGKSAVLKADSVTIQGTQTVKLKAQNFNAEGNMVTVKGQGSVKIESAAVAQIKGAMVKIN